MIPLMVLQVVLVLCDKLTRLTGQQFFRFHVDPNVLPIFNFFIRFEAAVSAFVTLPVLALAPIIIITVTVGAAIV